MRTSISPPSPDYMTDSMSGAPPSTPSKAAKARKEKDKQRSQPQESERLKIVVRRLPPNLPEDVFWQSVQRWVTDETTTWKVFNAGKLRKKSNKENIPSRAYIAFKTEEEVALFSREYDGHIFKDKNGLESQAVVEFAPHQKVPPEKKKPDGRNGTIDKDEDYISFLESLKAASNAEPVSLEDLIASSQPPPPPKTTPLLEALKAEKSAAKDREAILRNHAHYKVELAVRKDEKKRAPPAAPRPVAEPSAPNPPTSLGKKAAKKAQALAQAQAQAAAAIQAATVLPPNHNKTAVGTPSAPNARVQNMPAAGSSRPPRIPRAPRAAPSTANPVTVPATASPGSPTPTETPRRTRPVLGIASRQFEAALSIAGLANSASERRRREKEKGVDTSPTNEGTSGTSPKEGDPPLDGQDRPSTLAGQNPPSLTPTSPRKDKARRGGRVGASGRGGAPVKVPSILQRPDAQRNEVLPRSVPLITQRSAPSGSEVSPAPVIPESPGTNVSPLVAGGGNNVPRGRGRRVVRGGGSGGRGRGVPPSFPRGGG